MVRPSEYASVHIGVQIDINGLTYRTLHSNGQNQDPDTFRWNEQPLAFNYVFVHSTAAALNDLKQTRLPNLCYLMRPNEKGFDAKVIVPDEQMRNFIAIAGTSEERILYLPYSEVDLAHGDRVRITGGTFEGVEGIYQRIKGVRDKQVVVCIEGLVAVATATVPAYLVEKI